MKTVEQTRRGLFEAWVHYRQYLERNADGSYRQEWVDARWIGFNAALDAVEIELPCEVAEFADDDLGRRAFSLHTNNAIEQCRGAIESTNLGIKVK